MIVRVPASSANLGPGFDCFGIAWQLYNEIEFLKEGDGLKITGCPEQYCNKNNLCYIAYTEVLKYAGIEEHPLRINFLNNEIPISRGLGSSAALIVGGVTAANELNNLKLSKQELFSIATAVEGHPDNIAPAIFGGFTASAMELEKALSVSFPLSDKLHYTAFVPNTELSTELSRSVLPESYEKADAVFNISRTALLIKALESGDSNLLSTALQDKIHQPYRFKLIDGYEEAKNIALNLGACGMCISGAGSTMLCISEHEDFSEKAAQKIGEIFPAWKVLKLEPDNFGAVVL